MSAALFRFAPRERQLTFLWEEETNRLDFGLMTRTARRVQRGRRVCGWSLLPGEQSERFNPHEFPQKRTLPCAIAEFVTVNRLRRSMSCLCDAARESRSRPLISLTLKANGMHGKHGGQADFCVGSAGSIARGGRLE